jgi:hypothetical protein
MRFLLRTLLLAGTLLAGLVAVAPAMAAYTSPRLEVKNPNERLGGGGPLTISLSQSKDDDATFRVAIYIPQGYGAELGKAVGTQLGTVEARINAKAISPDAIVPVSGTIQVADPAPYRAAPQSVACAGTPDFAAVLLLNLTAAGQTLAVPMYVITPTSGPEAFAAAKLVACLPSPDIPPAQGGAQLGAKLISADLTFQNVFVNPFTAGNYVWRAVWTPYTFPATPNIAGTIETQSTDALPAQLTINVGRLNARNTLNVRGTLTEGGAPVAGATVRIQMGTTQKNLKQVATAKTGANGAYTATFRVRTASQSGRVVAFFRAITTVTKRDVACGTSPLGLQCLANNKSGFTLPGNRIIRARIR